MEQRLLLTYLNSGGGHLSGAKALKGGLEAIYPGQVECELLHGFSEKMRFERYFMEDLYSVSVNRFIWVYAFLYQFSRFKPVVSLELALSSARCASHIAHAIKRGNITKIVNFHFILEKACKDAIRMSGRDIKLVTVVMDPFTVPPVWFGMPDQDFVVFSDSAKRIAVNKYGVDPDRCAVMPIMMRREFEQPLSADKVTALKIKHGFDPSRPMLLLAGGGDGLRGAEGIVRAAVEKSFPGNLAVVCGKNEALLWRIHSELRKAGNPPFIKAYGFIDFMHELMNMADVVVSKGGPATIMETLSLGKPLIINHYVYGQERGNVDFAVKKGCGYWLTDPHEIIDKAVEIISSESIRKGFRANVERLNIRNGLEPTCRHVFDL